MSILVLSGLPASGKTTRAKEWVAEDSVNRLRVNYDDLRVELYGCKGSSYFGYKIIREDALRVRESMVKAAAIKRAQDWLELNPIEHAVIIDNTNLTVGARSIWEKLAKVVGVSYEQQDMPTNVDECVERDKKRKGDERVGRAVIERMALTTGWIDWRDERYRLSFVVVDIDGTLSDPSHRLHHIQNKSILEDINAPAPRDFKPRWDLFHAEVDKDPLKEPIRDLVQHLNADGYHGYDIIIVSGRSPEHGCGIKTEEWLDKHAIPYSHLFMRAAGDYKPDYEHKQEILDLLPKERIAFVLDDRDQVVKMWRANGLTCLQVAEGKF